MSIQECVVWLTCASFTGIEYRAHEISNELLYIECLRDDGTLDEEHYREHMWAEAELRLEGGQVAQPMP